MAAQGWCPTVLDTNGDGVITRPWNEPPRGRQPAEHDPALDTRVVVGSYGVIGDPTDDKVVWISSNRFPGRLARLHVGDDPPETCVTEMYEVPSALDPSVPRDKIGFGARGLDIDRDGVIWTALSGSSHLASFDRTKCAVHNGPESADGRHCVDGWTLYPTPGPVIAGTDPPVRADYHYYNWVDQWNTLGLGRDVPIATGSNSDSLLALDPATGEWTVLRVPYPQGFFTRGLDGRIDESRRGVEGTRGVGHLRRRRHLAHRGRPRREAGHAEVPGTPRPAGGVDRDLPGVRRPRFRSPPSRPARSLDRDSGQAVLRQRPGEFLPEAVARRNRR